MQQTCWDAQEYNRCSEQVTSCDHNRTNQMAVWVASNSYVIDILPREQTALQQLQSLWLIL